MLKITSYKYGESEMNNGVTRLFEALNNGEELTAKQISSRFNLSNPRDAIYTLRQNGYAVSLVERTDSSGRIKQKYTMRNDVPSISSYVVKSA
jgi:transcription initiation factor IIE alpha subunit